MHVRKSKSEDLQPYWLNNVNDGWVRVCWLNGCQIRLRSTRVAS
jgi:hypothetical protein